MEKIANAHPVIERAVRDFIQQHHDAGPEAGSSATPQPRQNHEQAAKVSVPYEHM
jgi:hypothetical protein